MKTATHICAQILQLARSGHWASGTHLAAQGLADRLRVSRQPINEALQQLQAQGVVRRERNRGFFLAVSHDQLPQDLSADAGAGDQDAAEAAYFRIADDRLRGDLPESATEAALRARYGLSKAELATVLNRISQEGWIERKPGYGWTFATMLTTPDSLLQSCRLRLALEPAALLEPGYRLDRAVLERCRAAEIHLLEGGIATAPADRMHDRGVNFHESLVEASGNAFFIDAIRRVNRVRRLLSYRSMQDRARYREHCEQHLHILELLEKQRNEEASRAMHAHLSSTLRNLGSISHILGAGAQAPVPATPPRAPT
ncbi:GntR family transcriptional regulator [Delftia sp. PS-11]|uniref:GntR family transcriptional regulator n=1 Tax=Delftia sp. PS-11 TaxID=2767222 RepID=UPI00245828F4|nr:GntR family transcriptional regulator [Delftia sp. PS-11]KAJ8744180.1 GntR family transcriptional regulator [Delftia sp. PS-11]